LDHLPKYGKKILVKYEKITYDCDGNEIKKYKLVPKVVADFKRIHFKENIFEFIEEQPLPKDADYLSDEEFQRLCENIHQLIPRNPFDRTIHTKPDLRSGYYLIEYYNGDKLLDYHCVKIGIPQAQNFIKKKDPYPLVVLPFKKDGNYCVGRMFYNRKSATIEMQRFLNMGIKRETMQILPFK